MAATEDNSIILRVGDEVEGERTGSDDYCFIGIGEAVPIKPGDDAEFDPQNPPSKPLSVSERFGLIFVSHSTGFCVARTKDIIDSAKEIAEKGSGSSIKELSVVDVPIGQVYILALSADSSTLAACIDGKIHFFSVASFLNKDQSPFFSCSLDDSSCVKDMQWTKKLENSYAVLSNHGNLYYGAGQDPLKNVMDDVDAFDWSLKGNLVAVARKNTLSIMSLKLKEKVCISLSFDSWIGDSNLNFAVKVDSIRWIRPDSIILGCFQLTSDGKEENYLVQVITSKDGKFTDTSSKPIVLSFSDVFEAFVDDIVPFGSGPYMSLSYLSTCELAITANRKSTDQHIVLFGWSLDDRKEAAVIDIVRDTLCPKIALQGNGDDNIVLGLCMDRISQNEKVEVQLGAEYKELSPFCILLCLSLDGKLFMYQVASVTGPSVPPDNFSLLSDEEDDTPTLVSSEDGKPSTSGGLVSKSVQEGLGFQSQGVDKKELLMKEGNGIPVTNAPMRPVNSERLETLGQQKFLVTKVDQDTVGQQSLLSAPQGPYFGHLSPKTSYLEEPGPVVIDFSKEETKKLPDRRIMTGVLMENFPDLIKSNPPSLRVSDLEVSSVSPKVDIIDMLQKASVPNFATDGSAAKQIKELSAEVTKLKWLLEEKEKLSVSEQPVPCSSWKDKVTGASSSSRMTLEFFPPIVDGQKIRVSPPVSVVEEGANRWQNCIVGYFIDKKLPFPPVKSIALNIWDRFGIEDVFSNERGFFFFKFGDDGAYRKILENCPWHFNGRLMVLQQWYPQMELAKVGLSKVPLWIQIFNIPLEYWNGPGLSYIASAVGKPLYADEVTEANQHLSFARVCVEVDIDSVLPESFELQFPNGVCTDLFVRYPWKPSRCSKCKVFGHNECSVPDVVPKAEGKIWVVKQGQGSIPAEVIATNPNLCVAPSANVVVNSVVGEGLSSVSGSSSSIAGLHSVDLNTSVVLGNGTDVVKGSSPVGIGPCPVVVPMSVCPVLSSSETSQTNELTLGSLGSFGIASSPNPTPGKPSPFGGAFGSVVSTPASSPFSMTVPTGELFRPASFSFQSPQPFQPSQLTNFGALSGGLSMGTTPQISAAGSGFGQPTQPGSGQQALGSVLGTFGQSRQIGGVGPGTSPSSASGFSGGLISSPSTGGFASSTGGGFAGAASPGGGFAAAAAASAGGGFAAAASAGGGFGGRGFGGVTAAGGGFAPPASAGGGFAGAASGSGFPSSGGGFGAFNSQQGSWGFSAFGSSAGGTGRPPSPLFTQMRK